MENDNALFCAETGNLINTANKVCSVTQDSSSSSLTLLICTNAGQELYCNNLRTSRNFKALAPANVQQNVLEIV